MIRKKKNRIYYKIEESQELEQVSFGNDFSTVERACMFTLDQLIEKTKEYKH